MEEKTQEAVKDPEPAPMGEPAPQSPRGEKIFSKNFWLFFIGTLTCASIQFLFTTTMAMYVVQVFNTGESLAGLAAGMMFGGAMVARLFVNRVVMVFGRRKTGMFALILMMVSCLLYLITWVSFPLLIVIRALHGIAFGIATTVLTSNVAAILPLARMGEGMGYYSLSISIATALGPMVGLAVTNGGNYNMLFWASAAACLVAVIAYSFTTKIDDAPRPEKLPPFKITDMVDFSTVGFSMYIFFLGAAYACISSFIGAWAAEIGLGDSVSTMFLFYAIFVIIVRPFMGMLLDKAGVNAAVFPTIICTAIALVMVAFLQNFFMLIVVGLLLAIGYGSSMSVGNAAVGKMVGGKDATLALATFFLCSDAGNAFGPFLFGFVATAFGYQVMFIAAAVVAVLDFFYYYLTFGRKIAKKDK